MDMIKIGRFIAEQRREKKLTQSELAERLGITDRAVSKWENGRSLPDASIMLELCSILGITVTDLLSGERVDMDNYNEQMEKRLIEMVKEKEQSDKRLLKMEIVMGIVAILPLLAAIVVASVVPMEEWKAAMIVYLSMIPLLVATPFALRIEQKAGFYMCQECGHKYVPKYGRVFFAMHMGRTRYLRCPECGKKSWQKKVLTKE